MIRLLAYRLHDGIDIVSAWYANQAGDSGLRAKLDARMIHLRQQPREGWKREPYDTLSDGIGEIRFERKNIQYRPLGFFGHPNRYDFTFLLFATKKEGKSATRWEPANALVLAVQRMEDLKSGLAYSTVLHRWGQIP